MAPPMEYPKPDQVEVISLAAATPAVTVLRKRLRHWGDLEPLGGSTTGGENTDTSEHDGSSSLRASWSWVSLDQQVLLTGGSFDARGSLWPRAVVPNCLGFF